MTGIHAAGFRDFFGYMLTPMFLLFFVLLCLIIYLFSRERGRVAKHAGIVLLLLWIGLYAVSTLWLPKLMITQFEQQYARVKQVDSNIHWVVVLGGGARSNASIPASDALSCASLKRVLEGVRLYHELPDAKLILSGAGTAEPEHTVAVRLMAFADSLQIPRADQVLEADSINTADEARLIKPLVGDAPFYLVTSALHMPRAMKLFKQQGLHPIAAPCDYLFVQSEAKKKETWKHFLPSENNIMRFNVAWHEYLGQIWLNVRERITHR